MKTCLERAEERIVWLLELEDLPFSLNTHYLADYKSKFFAYYKGSREEYNRADLMNAIRDYEGTAPAPTSDTSGRGMTKNPVVNVIEPTGIAKILTGLAEIGVTGVKPEDLAKLLPPDRMEPALTIMADIRAYFQGAYSRFAYSRVEHLFVGRLPQWRTSASRTSCRSRSTASWCAARRLTFCACCTGASA